MAPMACRTSVQIRCTTTPRCLGPSIPCRISLVLPFGTTDTSVFTSATVRSSKLSQVVGAACGKTREELISALERQPIDEDNARALLLQLAAEQYDAIGNTEYETVRLRRLLTGRKPMTELDAELLQSAVSKARVTSNCVTVTLKNGQTIERRDQP